MKGEKYLITAEENADSERWSEYLYYHLLKRVVRADRVELQRGVPLKHIPKEVKQIHFEVASDLKSDYCIEHTSRRLHVRVKENSTALWIIYQLIDRMVAEDPGITGEDLPPAVIEFNTGCADFDFEYREPFYSPNLVPEYAPVIGTNSLDTDWGSWGHNLSAMVGDGEEEELYALVDGKRVREQFCFSSPLLFTRLKEYIIDSHGEGEEHPARFMIMPNDNDISCTCPLCTQLGNSKENSTPAVHDLLRKLAERFPDHRFYTTAYRTTASPPSYQLPENCGVFFSTINLPKGVALEGHPQAKNFVKQVRAWRLKTPAIFSWDYTANFDDYLTPLPVLLGLQAQLRFFKDQGVKGVFLNASGYDYSPFDDVKTYVAAALMISLNENVETLVTRYYQKMYPRNHALLSDYYISLEKDFFEKNRPYNMYGGMRDNIATYLNVEKFVHFYESLGSAIPSTSGEEREKLEKLYTALTFARLQVAYVQGAGQWGYAYQDNKRMVVKPEMTLLVDELRKFVNYTDLQNYKEASGSLSDYIYQWEHLLQQGMYENALLATPVEVLSTRDEGFEKTELLTDGTPGFETDYHQGWYLSSRDDLRIRFPSEELQSAKFIRLRFLHLPKHGIYPPEAIELLIDGKPVPDQRIVRSDDSYSLPVNFNGASSVEVRISRSKKAKSILALDEVQVL